MSIIPEGQSEHSEGRAALRRMPGDGSGKTAYCQPGGVLEALAENREEEILRVAKADVERAMALTREEKVSKHQLVLALSYVCHSSMAATDVAECRGERLASLEDSDG
ncbi:hypothetical protein E0500_038525 [Streptomyces sp. KM273126]|uniref:hypothetical protein n=1 Tax=Streptomyces sp. KM273126 TaxID=2545247 RepID=UPI0010389680|nr:hypothetical protein [Streptomyces sp. KM273126]MBA2813055.1 hypothetical protein [Streptomyces sp. KM273126]